MAWKFNQVRSHCHPRRTGSSPIGEESPDGNASGWLRAVPGQGGITSPVGIAPALDGMECCPAICCSASINLLGMRQWRAHPYLCAHFQRAHG